MKKLGILLFACACVFSLHVHAYLTVPSTDADGNFAVSWTDSTVTSCNGQTFTWAFRLYETSSTGATRTINITSSSQRSYSITGRTPATYTYQLERHSCNLSNGNYNHSTPVVATASVLVSAAPRFNVSANSVSEGNTAYAVISKTGNNGLSYTLQYRTIYIGGAKENIDYSHRSGSITFAANETSKTIPIPTIEDSIYEGTESFVFALDSVSGDATIGTPSVSIGITNDDAAPSFRVNDASATEGNNVAFTITMTGASEATHQVAYSTAHGSATSGDYSSRTGSLTFNPSSGSSQTVSVPTSVDSVVEGAENFVLNISLTSGGGSISDSQGIGTINNRSNVTFSLSQPSVTEGGSAVFVVSKSGNNGLAHTVQFNTFDCCNARAGSDYTTASGTLSFAAADTSKSFTVSTINDSAYEGSEAFAARITNPSPGSVLGTATSTITIADNDAAPRFAISDVTVAEGGSKTLTVSKIGSTHQTHSVSYATETNTASQSDFVPASGTLSFGPSETSKTITVVAANDDVYEINEYFYVNLSAANNGATISDSRGVVTITSDDSPPVLSIEDASVSEGGTLRFKVNKSKSSDVSHSVSYTTVYIGGAKANEDYIEKTGTLTIPGGASSGFIDIVTVEDSYYENNESLVVNISAPTNNATLGDYSALGYVNNDDAAPSFSINNASATEGGNVTFNVTKTGETQYSHSVSYATANGSAGASDYVSKSGTLTFAANETSKSIVVATTNDTLSENSETFNVNLSGATSGAQISDAQGVGTINNLSNVTFSIADASATEGNNIVFIVTKSGNNGLSQTISYSTANTYNAVAGEDFTAKSGTISFTAAETSKTITVASIEDSLFEGNESFAVNISTSSPSAVISDSSAIGVINDDDSIPSISVGSVEVLEGELAAFAVKLSNPSVQEYEVNYATVSGSAEVHIDFDIESGGLTFAAGETEKTVFVRTKPDNENEDDETFSLTLSSPTNGATISNAEAVATIRNQEFSLFTIADDTAYEGEYLEFRINRVGILNTAVTLAYATVTLTAGSSDFETVSLGAVEFLAGETTKVIRVRVLHDTVQESSEDFNVVISSNQTGVGIADDTARGRIYDDGYLSAPNYVQVPTQVGGKFTVSWQPVRWDVSTYHVEKYSEYYDGRSGNWISTLVTNFPAPSSQTSIDDTSISSSTSNRFYYRVRACVSYPDNCSSWRKSANFTWGIPLGAPVITSLPATNNNGLYNIGWSESGAATYYQIDESFNGQPVATYTSNGDETTYELQKQESGKYSYHVHACNLAGCSPSISFSRDISVALPVATGLPTELIADQDILRDENGVIINDGVITVNIAEPNANGISINKFENLVTNQPLQLVSVNANPEEEYNRPETVVFVANNISFGDTVEMVGPAMDVVFIIAGSDNQLICNSCEFKNFMRVTLASHIGIPDLTEGVPLLSTAGDSEIVINSLDAQDVLALDIVSRNVTIGGNVNLMSRVSSSGNDAYSADPSGNLTMGLGGINVVSGVNVWNYDTQSIEQMYRDYDNQPTKIGGEIYATEFKLTATSPTEITARFDTRSDLLSTVRFNGIQHLTQEGVQLNLAYLEPTRIDSLIYSDGDVGIRAVGDLSLDFAGNEIVANKVDVLAGGDIVNLYKIEAEEVRLGGFSVVNEGDLIGHQIADIYSEDFIINQYGGNILARNLTLQSENGIIRNGARTAYQDGDQDNKSYISISSGFGATGIKMGTAYRKVGLLANPSTANNYLMPDETHAHIRGENVSIYTGKGFENINPYYKPVDDSGLFAMRKDLMSQVSTIADNELDIQAGSYILNASAIIGVQNENGILKADTRTFMNERYRIRTVLDFKTERSSTSTTTTTENSLYTKTLYYSPPGSIYSMGNLGIKAISSFTNSVSYIEVFGDAEFDTPWLREIGLKHYDLRESATYIRRNVYSCDTYASCVNAYQYTNLSSDESVVFDPQELDSLFYVQGDATSTSQSNSGKVIFENVDPFKEFLRSAVNNLVNSRIDDIAENGTIATNSTYYDVKTSVTVSNNLYTDQAILDDVIIIDWVQQGYWDQWVTYTPTDALPDHCTIYTPCEMQRRKIERGTETYSIWDTMMDYYNSSVGYISTLLDEFNWWE